MRRPPEGVVLVARTHWTVGAVIGVSTIILHFATRDLPVVEFGLRTYAIAGGLALLYLLAGTLVWCGAPFAIVVSRVCSLLYLPRPRMGLHLWETMNTPEFRAHFGPRPRRPATNDPR